MWRPDLDFKLSANLGYSPGEFDHLPVLIRISESIFSSHGFIRFV